MCSTTGRIASSRKIFQALRKMTPIRVSVTAEEYHVMRGSAAGEETTAVKSTRGEIGKTSRRPHGIVHSPGGAPSTIRFRAWEVSHGRQVPEAEEPQE